MTRDDFVRMAHKAGWKYLDGDDGYAPLWEFGELVAAAEREACAKVCDSYDVAEDVCSSDTAEGIAIAIRARGQQ
jgi:hypothetical protein